MISIQPFPLPSNPAKKIIFRAPTVGDCLDFCDLRPELEELSTTDYLNQLQEGVRDNSELWTAQDRRTALWWIFVSSSANTVLEYSYECQHCGDTHHVAIDLVDLDDGVVMLDGPAYQEGEVRVDGEFKPARFHPMDGRAMAHMEGLRLARENSEPAKYKRLTSELKIAEVLHSFTVMEWADLPWEEALDKKRELVTRMDRETEYKPLVAQCLLAAEELRHGLAVEIRDGRVDLVSPALPCEKHTAQEGDKEAAGEPAPATVLLLRFRPVHFIPAI
ncbi:hypothetical protein [Aeromonas hydrophila]|uniref:hypothetical protein n=1 Tax=Aeromonas hydrophila TaxID=644 RepID=UPI00080AA88C|nr:hypothetical protein [Aeromonas hydrophila]ANT70231.1 hypothetical protein TK34_22450 [Aeromonas hydrophila]